MNAGTVVYLVGFPAVVGSALVYMHMHRLSTSQDSIEVLGFAYTNFEAHVFYYGLLQILRQTLFVFIPVFISHFEAYRGMAYTI